MNAETALAALRAHSKRLSSPGALVTYLTMGTGMSMQLLTLLTGAMSARLLGVEGRGEFAAVTLLPMLIAALGDFGGPIAYTYLSAEDTSRAPALARNALFIAGVLGATLVLVMALVTPLYLRSYPDFIRVSVVFGALVIPASLLAKHLNAISQGTGRMVEFNLARLSGPIVYFLTLGLLMLVGVRSVPMAAAASALGTYAVLLASIRSAWPHVQSRLTPDRSLIRRTYAYGLRAHLGTTSPLDAFRVDLMLVVLFLDARQAGMYAVAVAAAMVIRAQASTLGLITVPSIVRQPTDQLKRSTACKYLVGTCVFTALVGFALFLLANPLVRLVYGLDFLPAVETTRILIVAMVLASFRTAIGSALRGLNVPGISSITELVSWMCVAAVLPFATAQFGLTGAAWGVTGSYACALLITLVLARRRFREA